MAFHCDNVSSSEDQILFQILGWNENLLEEFKSVPALRPPVCQSAGWRLQFKVSPTFLWPRNLYEIIFRQSCIVLIITGAPDPAINGNDHHIASKTDKLFWFVCD